jgi:hypothetical protein
MCSFEPNVHFFMKIWNSLQLNDWAWPAVDFWANGDPALYTLFHSNVPPYFWDLGVVTMVKKIFI